MAHLGFLQRCSSIVFRPTTLKACNLQPQVRTIKRWVAPTLHELYKRKKREGPQPLNPRSGYLEWNYDAELYAFSKRLNEQFQEHLLRRTFTHRSYVIKQELAGNTEPIEDNRELIQEGERLISDYINGRFKNEYPQEVVEAIRAYLTEEDVLALVAFHMGVKDLILSTDYPVEKRTLADTFKALAGALKHSTDLERAELFVNDFLVCQLNGKDVYDIWEPKNPYEYMLKLAREKGHAQIEPRLCNQSAVNTILANYQVGLYSNKKLLGIGWGESVDIAKDTAALDAIQKLQNFK